MSARAAVAIDLRTARFADVPQLERLMAPFVASGDLLPRSNYDLCRHVKEYLVAEVDGAVVACAALKVYSQTLAEIAALAVREDQQGRGHGRALVEALLAQARDAGLVEVLALTRKPAFFTRLGFVDVTLTNPTIALSPDFVFDFSGPLNISRGFHRLLFLSS